MEETTNLGDGEVLNTHGDDIHAEIGENRRLRRDTINQRDKKRPDEFTDEINPSHLGVYRYTLARTLGQ